MSDPRKAETLDEACKNPDGTYNGYRLLSFLTEATSPGKGMTGEEIKEMATEVFLKKKRKS